MMAEVLGYQVLAAGYRALAGRIGEAFRAKYVVRPGLLTSDTQTAYALALRFGLLAPEQTEVAGRRLAELVVQAGGRVATGFAGTPAIADALTMVGATETAYRLLLETGCPSWLYAVVQGATTVWERWDALLPDGSVNPGRMTSLDHYTLGSIADWLRHVVAGLAPASHGLPGDLVPDRARGVG